MKISGTATDMNIEGSFEKINRYIKVSLQKKNNSVTIITSFARMGLYPKLKNEVEELHSILSGYNGKTESVKKTTWQKWNPFIDEVYADLGGLDLNNLISGMNSSADALGSTFNINTTGVENSLNGLNNNVGNLNTNLTGANTNWSTTNNELGTANTNWNNSNNQIGNANINWNNTNNQIGNANTNWNNTNNQIGNANTNWNNTNNQIGNANTNWDNTNKQIDKAIRTGTIRISKLRIPIKTGRYK